MRIGNVISKSIQGLESAVFTAMVPYGEYLQQDALLKHRNYDWLQGHLVNIGNAGAVTAILLMLDNKNADKYLFAVPTAMTLFDLITSALPRSYFDWQDMGCYYGA